ncbi:1-acyl-sn-glycerol-3-phosphate acyltransferase [Candidatus Uhrbacteria bacterium]|nr:1-acyl-sn-glycerol-3-phosphate acyltransferase [Candidatus Uhrbacteria bacterium]
MPLKAIVFVARLIVGNILFFGVFAPLFFLIMFLWLTERFYLMRARAKRRGDYGSIAYRRSVTRWQALCSRVYTALLRTLLFVKVEIRWEEGAEILPNQSYLIISNHVSWFDTVLYPGLCNYIGLKDVRFVVKEAFLKHRLAYFVLSRTWEEAAFPFVSRTNPEEDLKRIEYSSKIALDDTASMLTFCEGTRQPDGMVGTPKWKGFCAQERIFQGRKIVSLTQCYDRPVSRTIWSGSSYLGRTIIIYVRVHEPLAPDIDRRGWLEEEFRHKDKLVRSIRG